MPDRPLSADAGLKPIAQHKYKLDQWVVQRGRQRTPKFRGRCTCGEQQKDAVHNAGLASSWHATHLEEVLSGQCP